MDLIAKDLSRLTVLLNASREAGQLYLPDAAALLVERYQFAQYPTMQDITNNSDVIEFKMGKFGQAAIDSMAIYNDGMAISSRSSTNFLDELFDDFSEFVKSALDLKFVKTHANDRSYDSSLVVHSNRNMLGVLDALADVGRAIQDGVAENFDVDFQFQPFGWVLSPNISAITGLKPSPFRLERKAGVDYSMNQYYSSAPLTTERHLKVLRMIENFS